MELSRIHHELQAEGHPGLAGGLGEARLWVDRAITTTRQLTVDLSPPVPEGEGLADALEWLQQQVKELHNLEIHVEVEHAVPTADEDLRVLLFHIVRDFVFNVNKHSGTDQATVRLVEEAGHLVIHVIDQGRGFDVEEVTARAERESGFGLFSARKRMKFLGGRVEINSRLGTGTHVSVHAPGPYEPPGRNESGIL